MTMGAMLYADDERGGPLAGTINDGDDDLNWLYGTYIKPVETFICPNTQNFIRKNLDYHDFTSRRERLHDLDYYAGGKKGYGSSYEVFGFMNATGSGRTLLSDRSGARYERGIRKTIHSVNSHVHEFNTFNLAGQRAGAANIWLMLDGDDVGNNYPTALGNHGSSGANVGFADAHVEFVESGSWVYRYELSQDEGRLSP